MTKKLMMLVEYPPSEASAGGGSMRGAVAVAFCAWAETETVGGAAGAYQFVAEAA